MDVRGDESTSCRFVALSLFRAFRVATVVSERYGHPGGHLSSPGGATAHRTPTTTIARRLLLLVSAGAPRAVVVGSIDLPHPPWMLAGLSYGKLNGRDELV